MVLCVAERGSACAVPMEGRAQNLLLLPTANKQSSSILVSCTRTGTEIGRSYPLSATTNKTTIRNISVFYPQHLRILGVLPESVFYPGTFGLLTSVVGLATQRATADGTTAKVGPSRPLVCATVVSARIPNEEIIHVHSQLLSVTKQASQKG